jgi:hypothetical protein
MKWCVPPPQPVPKIRDMKKAILLLICAGWVSPVFAEDAKGALANLRAVPAEFQNGILKLSADNCDPNPDIWYVSAKSDLKKGGVQNFELAAGQVVSSKSSLGLREALGSNKPIDLAKIQFDSRDAFDLAQRYARANHKTIDSVSLVLSQQGSAAVPLWSVWCYGPNGKYFGELQLLATDGTVISNGAFPKKP